MFYAQIFNNFGEKKSLTKRYGPSAEDTWAKVIQYAQFLQVQYRIRVFIKTFDRKR